MTRDAGKQSVNQQSMESCLPKKADEEEGRRRELEIKVFQWCHHCGFVFVQHRTMKISQKRTKLAVNISSRK